MISVDVFKSRYEDLDRENIRVMSKFLVVAYYLFAISYYFSHALFVKADMGIVITMTVVSFVFATVILLSHLFIENHHIKIYINMSILIMSYILTHVFMNNNGGITTWALIFLLIAISMLYQSKIVIIAIIAVGILSTAYYMVFYERITYTFSDTDYFIRMGIVVLATVIILLVNNRYRKRLYEYYQLVDEKTALNAELVASEVALKNQQSNLLLLNQKVDELAFIDPITQLPNKNAMFAEFPLGTAYDDQGVMRGVAYIDIDHFKQINDTHSHQVGDEFLLGLAEMVSKVMAKYEHRFFRIGGDEFFLVVDHLKNKQEMLQIVNRIQTSLIQNQEQVFYAMQMHLTIGVAIYPYDGFLFTELYKKSKIALLHAKKFSRGKCFFYSKEIMEAFEYKSQMQKALINCLTNKEIEVFYQPVYNLATRKIKGFEALMRWHSEVFGEVSPVEFIPYAEENMMILDMGLWVMEKSIQDILAINETFDEAFTININVSAIQLRSSKFIQYLASMIDKYSIYPGLIELEITENVLIESLKNGVEILTKLKLLGVTIALDDFGTGYSSIAYLHKLPIDVLKIDRSFIKEIHDEKEVAIIKSIVEMAYQYKREIIAEGVETRKQFELIKEMGCHYGQGYLFAVPMPIKDLIEYIEQFN